MSEAAAPTLNAVRDTIEMLTGRDVDLALSDDTSDGPGYASEFISYKTEAAAVVCSVDIELAAGLGAILAMMPPGIAKEQASEGELSGSLLDNYLEVINVMTGMFDQPGHPGVRLEETYDRPSNLNRIAGALPGLPRPATFNIDLGQHGSGLVTFWV